MALTVHYNYQGNWTALFCIGDRISPPPALTRVERLYIFRNSAGYDGQSYHDLAHDPLLIHGTAAYIDGPRLRQRRILVPALAWVLAAGRQQWIDSAYFAIMLAFVGAGTFWLARYIADYLGRSSWWGLLYLAVPSTIISIDRMTTDLVLTSLFVGFAYYVRSGPLLTLWSLATAACLTRETGLCIAGGYALYLLWQHKLVRAAVFATSAIPFFAWFAYVNTHQTARGDPSLSGYPFNAFVSVVLHPLAYIEPPAIRMGLDAFDIATLAAFVATLALACWIARREPLLGWITIPFVVLALVLGNLPGEYVEIYGYGRPFSPILVVVLLDALARRSRPGFALFGIISARSLVMIASEAYRVLRGMVG